MLVNFDIGADPVFAKQKLRGGRWRDRLVARHASRGTDHTSKRLAVFAAPQSEDHVRPDDARTDRNISSASQGPHVSEVSPERQPKRRKLSFGQTTTAPSSRTSSSHYAQGAAKARHPQQVVSSLFSFNPLAKTEKAVTEEAVVTEPSNAPLVDGIDTFTSLGLSSVLAAHLLEKLELKHPTAIQRASIQKLVHSDSDGFLQAETGSGKTLAYLLPIVQKIMSLSDSTQRIHRNSGLFAIVLSPTRELSKQVSVVLENLLRCAPWIVSGTVIGGEKKKSEKARLRKGVNILIATPGRLADHIDHTEVLDVSQVRWLVLDEGDRLMELGFEEDIRKLVSKLDFRLVNSTSVRGLPERRSTILCSATMKSNVQELGSISLKDAIYIKADVDQEGASETKSSQTVESTFSAPAQLKQAFAIVPAKLRLATLHAFLKRAFIRKGNIMKAIVFFSCADSVDFHFEIFARGSAPEEPPISDDTQPYAAGISHPGSKVELFKLHGSLSQAIRTSTLKAFRSCSNPAVLICTDVASRGLDLPNVDYVIEYDPPFSKDDHLHRVGRTARAGKDGRALIFLMPGSEEDYVKVLKDARHDGIGDIVRHDAEEQLRKGFAPTGIHKDSAWEEHATEWQLEAERWVLEDPKRLEQARKAYQSHVRAYATHVAAERHMFDLAQLHLGHLAKAFGLRDKPGSIRVPGLRPSKAEGNAAKLRRRSDAKSSASNAADGSAESRAAARKMMQAKFKNQLGGASEFNLG